MDRDPLLLLLHSPSLFSKVPIYPSLPIRIPLLLAPLFVVLPEEKEKTFSYHRKKNLNIELLPSLSLYTTDAATSIMRQAGGMCVGACRASAAAGCVSLDKGRRNAYEREQKKKKKFHSSQRPAISKRGVVRASSSSSFFFIFRIDPHERRRRKLTYFMCCSWHSRFFFHAHGRKSSSYPS